MITIRLDNEYCDCRGHPRDCVHEPPPYPLKRTITFQITLAQFNEWIASPMRQSQVTLRVIDRFGDNRYYHPDPHVWFGKHYPHPESRDEVTVNYPPYIK